MSKPLQCPLMAPNRLARGTVLAALIAVSSWLGATPVLTEFAVRPADRTQTPAERKLQSGFDAVARRDFKGADSLFKEAAALDRGSSAPLLALAENARARNDEAATEKWLLQALQVAPHDVATLSAWGRWHYAHRQYQKALEFWNRALAADPRSTSTLVDLGDCYFDAFGKPRQAGEFYRKALAINPSLAGAHYALGKVHLRLEETGEALRQFELAAKLSPANPLPFQALGQTHALRGDKPQALAAYDQAIKEHPAYYPVRLDKGDLLLSLNKWNEALAEYSAVEKTNPKVADGHLKAGMTLQQLGRLDEAYAAYKSVLLLEPNQAVALNNLAWLASERPDVSDRGLMWARKAVSLNGSEPRFRGTLAWVQLKRGETAEALQAFDQLSKGAGKAIPELHYLRGVAWAEKGDTGKAAEAFREALRLDASFAQAADATARLRKLESR